MKTFSYRFTVTKDAIDFNGHVHNVTYLRWMIEAATKHSESVGFGYEKCLELGGTWVARAHNIEYRRPAFEEDTLQMETWVEETGKSMSVRHYVISRVDDGTAVCEGRTEWVFVDAVKMRPMKIPAAIVARFERAQED